MKSVYICAFTCIMTFINLADVFSTIVSIWHAYNINSKYKEAFTFFTVSYHCIQIILFLAMCFYIFRIRKYFVLVSLYYLDCIKIGDYLDL